MGNPHNYTIATDEEKVNFDDLLISEGRKTLKRVKQLLQKLIQYRLWKLSLLVR